MSSSVFCSLLWLEESHLETGGEEVAAGLWLLYLLCTGRFIFPLGQGVPDGVRAQLGLG